MSQIHRHPVEPATDESAEPVETSTVSIAHVVAVLRTYASTIVLAISAVVIGYVLVALAYYALSPSVIMTRLPFRLEFDGAERGQYPNGLKFSSSEIVSTPILTNVYAANSLARYLSFRDFKESVFVQESNPELQRLEADYQSRLSDPKLSPLDRERIERDFDLKKESLRSADFALVMVSSRVVRRLPTDLREKVLSDILSRWAEIADKEKGALRYRVPVLTSNVIQRSMFGNSEHIVALDILRSRVNRVLSNIDVLLTIPGAETVRVGDSRTSLEETRVRLDDVRRFQIEPLITRIYVRGLINDPRATLAYLETQLGAAQREYQDAQLRVSTLQNALTTYMGRSVANPSTTDTASASNNHQQNPASSAGGQAVVPQLSDSFLDRVVRLVSDTQDKAYRQALVDQSNKEAFQRLLPAEKEVRYYTELLEQMRARGAVAGSRGADELRALDDAQNAAFNEVLQSVEQVGEVYKALSRNLDPDTMLYTRTSPIFTVTERSVSGFRLLIFGVLATLLAIPLILAGAFLHARLREEEEADQHIVAAQSPM